MLRNARACSPPGDIIKSCSNLLNDNGDIFFSTINRNPKSYLFAVIGAEYVLNLLPKGTHDYEKFIKPSELAKWIRDAGLTSKETIGLSYNPITDNYWLGKDIQVNYMVHAKKGSSLKNIELFAFDLDGTLLDTAPDFLYAVNVLRERYNLEEADLSELGQEYRKVRQAWPPTL